MKIVELSVRRRVTVAMFTIAILLFGLVSFDRLKVNLLPDLSYPTLTIRTEYRGAAPAEVENLISKPIEEALGIVKNVQQVRSVSRSGQSDVLLEFTWGTAMDFASLDVREKLDALQLPLEATKPVILRFDPSLDPIIRLALYQKNPDNEDHHPMYAALSPGILSMNQEFSLKHLRRLGDELIKKELESVPGVAAVKISGGLEDEIQIYVDQARLAKLNIPIENVIDVLSAENVNLSGGRLEEGKHTYLVRTLNEFRSVPEIDHTILTTRQGRPVYLRDIAQVRQGFKERTAITRLNGEEAVEIAIYKEGDANTVTVSHQLDRRLDRLAGILPQEVALETVADQSVFIEQAVDEVLKAGLIGGLLAIIILYLFLRNVWTTIIISFSIPISVIATFNLMHGLDITLNIMSLGGIALGIGLLVDNSIVVLENISRYREQGTDGNTAARVGASEVGAAVTASTLTTIAVFFPLVFVQGIAGQLFKDQALTVTFALLASLWVALTIIPMLASWGWRKRNSATEQQEIPVKRLKRFRFTIFTRIPAFMLRQFLRIVFGIGKFILVLIKPVLDLFQKGYGLLEKQYIPVIKWAIGHRRTVLGTAALLFICTLLLIPGLGVELIPQLSQGEFKVEFKLPPGTPLERTDLLLKTVHDETSGFENIATTFAVAGSGNRLDANPEQMGENWGEISVKMQSAVTREKEEGLMSVLREQFTEIPGTAHKFSRPALFTLKTPVEIEIIGYDLDRLRQVSRMLVGRMEALPRFADIKSTVESGHPEIRIIFDRERAAALGIPVYRAAERLVSKVRGTVASKYSWHDRKIDIVVRCREEDRTSIADIRNLIINPECECPVTLDEIARIVEDTGPAEINRVGQERVAIISANLNFGDLGSAAEELYALLSDFPRPHDIDIQLAGQNEEMAVSFSSLRFALVLAVFLVYLVMASQFESLIHPFVIIFTIPLALIGAVLALWITGSTINVVVFIGLILLAGIVVNNAIVLIDLINKLRARGVPKTEAIIEAGHARLRPILMTTLTTTLGLLPLALGFGEGAELRSPMAITVIGGLLVATMLTLVVIPVVYDLLDRKQFAAASTAGDAV